MLRRAGDPVFIGRVASHPQLASGSAESTSVELRNVWWDLERTQALSRWWSQTRVGGVMIRQRQSHPRLRVGRTEDGQRATIQQELSRLMAAAQDLGIDVAGSYAISGICPDGLEVNRTLAELIRSVLATRPDAIVTAAYADTGLTTLRIVDADHQPVKDLVVDHGVTVQLVARPDLKPRNVVLRYETDVLHRSLAPPAPGEESPRLVSERQQVVFEDSYPSSAITRHTLMLTVPGNPGEVDEVPFQQARRSEVKVHSSPVRTRPIPADGAHDKAACRWWYDQLGLEACGLLLDDIRLPQSDQGAVSTHRVSFATEAPDIDLPPSPINPSSVPLSRREGFEPADFPRQLIEGSLAEWMGVRWTELHATASIAIAASAVGALPDRQRLQILGRQPGRHIIDEEGYYIVSAEARLTATNALTKVYTTGVSVLAGVAGTSQADLDEANTAAVQAAQEASIIPGLARQLYQSRSRLWHAGSITIASDEPGEIEWAGYLARVMLPGSWTEAMGQVQGEEWDLFNGGTRITLGPPEQVAAQDWAAMRDAAQRSREQAMTEWAADPSQLSVAGHVPDTSTPVVGASATPMNRATWAGLGLAAEDPAPWDLEVQPDGTVKVKVGTINDGMNRLDGECSISGSDSFWSVANGDWLGLEITLDEGEIVATLALWRPWPLADNRMAEAEVLTISGQAVTLFSRFCYPLWRITAADSGGDTQINEELWGQRVGPKSHLGIVVRQMHTESGPVYGPALEPSWQVVL